MNTTRDHPAPRSLVFPRSIAALACLTVGLAALVVQGGDRWRGVLAPSPQRDLQGEVDFRQPRETWASPPVALTLAGDTRLTSDGLILDNQSWLRLHTPTPADRLDLSLFANPPQTVWRVTLGDGDGHPLRTTAQRGIGDRRRYRLDPERPGLWVTVASAETAPSPLPEATRAPAAAAARASSAALTSLRYTFAHRRANALPAVPLLLAAILTTGILVRLSFEPRDARTPSCVPGARESGAGWRWGLRGVAVLYGLVFVHLLETWALSEIQRFLVFSLHFGALMAGVGLLQQRGASDDASSEESPSPADPASRGAFGGASRPWRPGAEVWFWWMAALVLLGLQVRWGGFADHRRQALLPDAEGFLEIVRGGGWYATAASAGPWVREPLWIWINRAAGWMLGPTENTLRLVSLGLGLATLVQAARLGARWFGPAVGLMAAAGLALSPRWVEWTAHGLRTELYTLLVLTFALAWDRARETPRGGSAREAGRLGLLAAAGHLTYIASLAWTLPLLGWRFARGRWRAGWIAACLALALVPLLPHLAFNYRFEDSKDPFFSSNVHARFYRNYERYGLPGSPDRERFLADPYGGPPITTLGYLFGERHPVALARGAARGAWNIYVYRVAGIEQFMASKFLVAVYAFGVLAALASKSKRRSLGLFVWLGLPFWFLASLPGFPTRLLAPLTPWMWFYLALGFATAAHGIACLAAAAPPITNKE